MASGPRKFSEKIALLNQKEAEGNAAFASIMGEVKSIRPSGSNSGSQLDMLENDCLTDKNHSTIEETIRFNESINVTYMNERHHQQQQQQQQFQSQIHKKHLEQQNINKTDLQHPQQQFAMNNSFLQLPNQNDSFRRAHSDSSLNQSVANASQMGMNFNQDSVYQQQQHQSQLAPHLQQQQQLQYNQQVQFNQQFYQQQQQQPQQSVYHQASQQQQQQQSHSSFVQGSNEFNAIPFRNLSLPITTQMMPQSPTNFPINLTSPTTSTSNNNLNNNKEPKSKSLTSPTKSNAASPTSTLSPTLISPHHALNKEPNNNLSPSYLQQQTSNQFIYPTNLQQQQQQKHQYQQQFQQQPIQNSDHLLSPTTNNNNFLNANIQNTAGGSLPDLTSFQFQNNQTQQMLQLQEYNNKRQQQQQQQQQTQLHHHHQHHHHHHHQQQTHHQEQVYDFSSQMLQPNFPQHNHIGPVKPTHSSSVSPVRGASRYSPTHSNSNINSISNRRSSPQHLGLNKQLLSNTSAQSSPTSPQHPSVQSFPALEFTISSYMPSSPNVLGGNNQQQTQTNGCIQNNIVYRTNSTSTCTTGAESLPPSPQSQHSCFNSPQGSPGPISISPQDLNPFTSTNNQNNYDIMQKKFDSINLETNNSFKGYTGGGGGGTPCVSNQNHIYGQYSPVSALSPTSPTGPAQSIGLVLSPRSPTSPVNNNMNLNSSMHGKTIMKSGINNGIANIESSTNSTKLDNNNDNLLNNSNTSVTSANINTTITNDTNGKDKITNNLNGKIDCHNIDEIGIGNKLLMNATNNGNNNILANDTGLVDIDQMNFNHLMHHHHLHHSPHMIQHSNNDLLNGIKTNPDNNSLINKTHKNSIPNIIFTFSGDSIDDKNDNILKDISHDSMYNDDLLINKNEPINDLDLQMLSDGMNESENTNNCIGIYQNT